MLSVRRNRAAQQGLFGLSWSGRPYAMISQDRRYADAYTRWHWGINPKHVTEWEDKSVDARGRPVYPDVLVECGRLVQLKFKVPHQKEQAMTLETKQTNRSYLTFDPDHVFGRLYVMLPQDVAQEARRTYWQGNAFEAKKMNELASLVGGRHGKLQDYPEIAVKPIGLLTSFSYAGEKEGDGYSSYVHRAGEESGIRPLHPIDTKGRLWIVGGNYTSPTPGVTD